VIELLDELLEATYQGGDVATLTRYVIATGIGCGRRSDYWLQQWQLLSRSSAIKTRVLARCWSECSSDSLRQRSICHTLNSILKYLDRSDGELALPSAFPCHFT
jgi:hypothetical protein